MAAVDMDRQAIERRDFPIARRGYATAAVDAHLRALAAEIEELSRPSPGEDEGTLSATASTQVQSILQAAETAARELEHQAAQSAYEMREEAERDAEATREQAISQARAHVTAVAQATSILLERVSSMDAEVSALVEGLRAGASMLAGDLAAVDRNMGELYDAASQGAAADRPSPATGEQPYAEDGSAGEEPPGPAVAPAPLAVPEPQAGEYEYEEPFELAPEGPEELVEVETAEEGDLDGARLIALNMALNGDSRADTDRYLAENFELSDRQRLIDEVYAAVEG